MSINCQKFPSHPSCKKNTPTSPPTSPSVSPSIADLLKNVKKVLELDTDNDGIPDVLEKNGYTVSHTWEEDHFLVYPWLEEYDHDPNYYNNHSKYVSNPYLKNTVGDPYTDLEKAGKSIYIDGKVLPEAYNPLVAAFPSVAIFMEGFTLSPRKETEQTTANRVSYHTSYGFTETHTTTEGKDVSHAGKLEVGGKGGVNVGPKQHVSGSLQGGIYLSTNLKHHTADEEGVITTSSIQETHQQSTEESTTVSSINNAMLTGIVRYRNMGTAMINNVRPTLNFQIGNQPLMTYEVPKVEKLSPGEVYPSLNNTGIAVTPKNTLNEQGEAQALTVEMKNKILTREPLQIKTLQIKGTFTVGQGSETHKPGEEVDWSTVDTDMSKNTARLLLETPNETLDRRVAALSTYDETPHESKPESWTPKLTVEKAIQIAFGSKPDNRGNLIVTTPQGFTYRIDRSHVTLYVDQKTDDLIAKQLQVFKDKGDETKSVYDVILTKEMVILIKPILEVRAFLSNAYLYIENQFDQSLSYSVWKKTGTSSELLKQGIVPSASTIGTGYFCGNPAEELSIMVSRQVSQVIFEGNVSKLTGFVEEKIETLLPEDEVIHSGIGEPITFSESWTENFEDRYFYKGNVKVEYNDGNLLITYNVSPWQGNIETSQNPYTPISTSLIIDNDYTPIHNADTVLGEHLFYYINEVRTFYDSYTLKKPVQRVRFNYKIGNSVAKKTSPVFDQYLGIKHKYNNKLNDKQIMDDFSELAIYKHNGFVYLYNKTNRNINYSILNTNQHLIYEGNLLPEKDCKYGIYALTRDWGVMYKEADDKTLIFTVNNKPVYKITVNDIINDDHDTFSNQIQKAHRIDYWHINPFSATYDSIYFQKIDPKILSLLTKYEIKVNKTVLSETPIPVRSPALDGKIMINFFDYTADTSKHPKKGQQVEIVVHDIFGKTTSVFKGTAELSDALWSEHYKVSEWYKKGNRFDALYLLPVPTGLTESVKAYDIQIGTNEPEPISFERQDNGGYIHDQRLKLDFSKKFPQDKLPKLGDSVHLVIHTIENQTVTIDLGKIAESVQPDSINALENAHDITKWTKDKDYYTHVQFNKGSEHIKSYVFQVNNRYYGEIPVNQTTIELDLSKLDTDKKIRKGDYVEIYAYKKDGEGVLIQSRYAGTTGLLGAYPAKEKIQQEYHVTSWSKVPDSYTSFTLGPLSDPIDSYIKKYEGCINNSIINLTPNGLTFTFDTDKGPRHGDIVQLFAYTYSGEKIELWKLLAGAIGTVTDEAARFIHQLKEWADTNKTILFDTSKLQDPIQAHVKSYTIEVWKGQNTNWETFGSPIQMNAQGQLRLQDCNASQSFPQSPNAVRVLANLFDSGRNPIVVMVRKVGEIKPPPTQKDIEDTHKDFIWNFDQEKLKSITFPHVDSETASYIASYQVNRWSEPTGKIIFQVDNKGVTVEFDKPIAVTTMQDEPDGPGKTKQVRVTAQFLAFACCINIEKETKLQPILVIGSHTGEKGVIGVLPVRSISKADIVQAHDIEDWIYQNGHVTMFYFNQKVKPYLKEILYYSIKINETEYPPVDTKQVLSVEKEEDKDGHATGPKGLPIRFGNFGLTGGSGKEFPKPGNKLGVIAHLSNSASDANGQTTKEVPVIDNYVIPEPPNSYLSQAEIDKLVQAHQPPHSLLGHFWKNDPNGPDPHYDIILFEDTVKPYLQYIAHYCININGTDYCPKQENTWLGLEQQDKEGQWFRLLLRTDAYSIPYNKRPLSTDSITVFAHLKEDYAPESSRIIPVFSHNTH